MKITGAFRRIQLNRRLGNLFIACSVMSIIISTDSVAQVSITSGLSTPRPSIISLGGGNLYFGQLNQSNCKSELDRTPADTSNGAWLTVVSGLGYRDPYGSCRGIGRIALSGSKILYDYGSYDQGSISIANLDGSSSKILVSNYSGGNLLGVMNKTLYYTTGFSTINKVPISGGASSSSLASSFFVRSSVVDSHDGASGVIYFVDYYSNGLWKYDAASNSTQQLISGANQEGSVLDDSNNVYLVLSNGIFQDPKTKSCAIGSTCVQLWPPLGQGGTVQTFSIGRKYVFVSDGTSVWGIPTNGMSATKLYSGSSVRVIEANTNSVYFTDGASLYQMPFGVTSPTVSKPMLLSSAVDYDSGPLAYGLYWTSVAGRTDGAGSAHMVVEQVSQLDSLQYSSTVAAKEAPCACLSTIFAQLARTILRAQNPAFGTQNGLGVPTNITIDNFFDVINPSSPCSLAGGAGADWNGFSPFHNPVYGAAQGTDASNSKPMQFFNISSKLSAGPVILDGSVVGASGVTESHYILATDQAAVQYGGKKYTGIVAFDPLSGSKVFLTGGSGSYSVKLMLDPVTSQWCAFGDVCAGANNTTLVSHINKPTFSPQFGVNDLNVLMRFVPNHYRAVTVLP